MGDEVWALVISNGVGGHTLQPCEVELVGVTIFE